MNEDDFAHAHDEEDAWLAYGNSSRAAQRPATSPSRAAPASSASRLRPQSVTGAWRVGGGRDRSPTRSPTAMRVSSEARARAHSPAPALATASHAVPAGEAQQARAGPAALRPRPLLSEMTVSAILDQAHQREVLIRHEVESIGGGSANLAEIESAMADKLLDEVISEQAGSLSRAAQSVVDRLCEAEVGPALSASGADM